MEPVAGTGTPQEDKDVVTDGIGGRKREEVRRCSASYSVSGEMEGGHLQREARWKS